MDNDGVIYVADWLNNRLQVFDLMAILSRRAPVMQRSPSGARKAGRECGDVGRAAARLQVGTGKGFLGPTGVCGR